MRIDILEKKEQIMTMIQNNESKSSMCKELNCRPSTLDSYLKKLEIDYSGNQGLKGKKTDSKRRTALDYIESGDIVQSHWLRIKLIQDGIKEHKCENCKLIDWLGEKISLELHHIDGNRFNNQLDNLQILCPNCHSITDNYSGKKNIKEVKIKKPKPKTKKCDCGNLISDKAITCLDCKFEKSKKVNRPDYNILINDVSILNYTGTGQKYGVSGNAIRKWIKSYEKTV
jgi:5-methylcytosine-specific restriction endonuclease McrA